MVAEEELEGFRKDRYLARSWALLTQQKGWIKPVLVLTVALIVPVVGMLGLMGYAAEWARLTAWGVNAAPKQKNVDVGGCIKSGWRVFVLALVWGLVAGAVMWVVSLLPIVNLFSGLLGVVVTLATGVLVNVAALRATVYQKIGAGLRVSRIWEMVSHDPKGLLRIVGIAVLFDVINALVGFVVTVLALFASLPILYQIYMVFEYGYPSSPMFSLVNGITSLLGSLGPALVIVLLVTGFLSVLAELVGLTATGLWMRQFNVPAWGAEDAALPDFVSDPRDGEGGSAAWADSVFVPSEKPASDHSAPASPVQPAAQSAVEKPVEPQAADPAMDDGPSPAPVVADGPDSPSGEAPTEGEKPTAPATEPAPVDDAPATASDGDVPDAAEAPSSDGSAPVEPQD